MYTALAEVYDLFAESDAQKRGEYYARFLPAGGEGVDIGCGTGEVTLALYRLGFRVYGVDASAAMLSAASDKALRSGADIRFIAGDAACVPYVHPLDFAVAANDVFNYVPRLAPAFASVYKALRSGGVFAFDMSSAYKLENVLAGNTFSETKNDITYVWKNFRSGNKLNIDFTVFSPRGHRRSDRRVACGGVYGRACLCVRKKEQTPTRNGTNSVRGGKTVRKAE